MASPQLDKTSDTDHFPNVDPTLFGESNDSFAGDIGLSFLDARTDESAQVKPLSPSYYLGDEMGPNDPIDPRLHEQTFENWLLAPAQNPTSQSARPTAEPPSNSAGQTPGHGNRSDPNSNQRGEVESVHPLTKPPEIKSEAAAQVTHGRPHQASRQRGQLMPSFQPAPVGGMQPQMYGSGQASSPDGLSGFGPSQPNNPPHPQFMAAPEYAQYANSGYQHMQYPMIPLNAYRQQVQYPLAPTTPIARQDRRRFRKPPPIQTHANAPGNTQTNTQSPTYPSPPAGIVYPNHMPYFNGYPPYMSPGSPLTPGGGFYGWVPVGAPLPVGTQQPAGPVAVEQPVREQPTRIRVVQDDRRKRKRVNEPTDADKVYHEDPDLPPLDPLPSWGTDAQGAPLFNYNEYQELSLHVTYSASQIRQFIEENPRKLKLWIQQSPPQTKNRLKGTRNKCCWECCPTRDRVIETGWLRVGFYEFPRETKDSLRDPLKPTTQMHLYCYEQCFDPVVDFQAGRLEPDDFVFKRESRQLTSLNKNSDRNIVGQAYIPWFKNRPIANQRRPYGDTLSYALNRHHLDHQTSARQQKRDKGNANKENASRKTIDVHVGDLWYYTKRTNNVSIYAEVGGVLLPGNEFQIRTLESTLAHQRLREALLAPQTGTLPISDFGPSLDNKFQVGGQETNALPNLYNGQGVGIPQKHDFSNQFSNEWFGQQASEFDNSFVEPDTKRRRYGPS